MWILYTSIAMVFYTIAEYYSKKYATFGNNKYLLISIMTYIMVMLLWFPALSNKNELCVLNLMWTMMYALIGSFLGLIIFKEVLTPIQMLGVGLAFISIFLMCK